MKQMQLKQKDLIPYIGNKSKVSEVLNRKIGLSLNMIINLSKGLRLPLETLIPKSSGWTHKPKSEVRFFGDAWLLNGGYSTPARFETRFEAWT